MKHYRAGWISDMHLGTRGSQAEALLDFLRTHQFDILYIVGDLIDVGYQLLLKLNRPINALRRVLGWPYWSLSAYVKKSVKNAVNFVGAFEEAIVRFAADARVDGVVCGHIHSPVIREISGISYYNSGDWVESMSALVEDHAGRIELINRFS